MSNGRDQYLLISAAALFLIGAVFMLINTFGGIGWALWVGIACAAAALLLYILMIAVQQFRKPHTVTTEEPKETAKE
jgi:O-antigen/teichoic acid export membrane protein